MFSSIKSKTFECEALPVSAISKILPDIVVAGAFQEGIIKILQIMNLDVVCQQ